MANHKSNGKNTEKSGKRDGRQLQRKKTPNHKVKSYT